jgi:hypothetical protein
LPKWNRDESAVKLEMHGTGVEFFDDDEDTDHEIDFGPDMLTDEG